MSSSPKIILLGPASPYRGGIADTQEALHKALKKLGVEIELITFKTLYPQLLFPGKSPLREDANEKQSYLRLMHTYNPLFWWKCAQWINTQEATAVVVRYWTPFVALSWWGIRKFLKPNIKMIGMVDNWTPHESKPFDRPLRRLFEKSCSCFISLSENVGKQIAKDTTKKVAQGFHPIANDLPAPITQNEARKRLGLPETKKIIAFVGLIRKYKGIPLLLDSFAAALKKDANLFLSISGEFYTDQKATFEKITSLGIEEQVHVHPKFLSAEKMRDYICAADIIAQPYIKATQSGITPLAYIYEKPLLVSAVEGLQDPILKDGTGKAARRTTSAWTSAMLEMLKEKDTALYTSALQKVKNKYQWEQFAKLLLELSSD